MRKISRIFLVLAIASVFIIITDGLVMRYKVLFGGDEIISYLCATGNEGTYLEVLHKKYPYGKLTDAGEWKKFIEISEPYCFKKIAGDLCTTDLHPPLYFWILHLFVLKFGVHIYTGILLNLVLQLFTLFAIFKLSFLIFDHKNKAAYAALVWALTPACMMVSLNARPYELLEFVSVIYFLNFFLWQKKAGRLNAFLLAILGAVGLLTHYSFMYVMATCFLFSLWRFKQIGWRNILVLGVAAMVSYEIMAMIHPCYADSFVLQQARRQLFSLNEVPMRVGKSILSFIEFFVPVLSIKQPGIHFSVRLMELMIILILIVLTSACVLRKQVKMAYTEIRKINLNSIFESEGLKFAWFVFIMLSCAVLLPYFLFITPFHAMGGQYLVYLYPFMAILCTALVSTFARKIKIFFSTLLFSGSVLVLSIMIYWNQHWYIHLIESVQQNKVIVVNAIDRRAFPRLIPYLKKEQQILMDENAIYENDSLLVHSTFLMINTEQNAEAAEKYGAKDYTLYDTNDGVEFFTSTINAEPSVSPLLLK